MVFNLALFLNQNVVLLIKRIIDSKKIYRNLFYHVTFFFNTNIHTLKVTAYFQIEKQRPGGILFYRRQ